MPFFFHGPRDTSSSMLDLISLSFLSTSSGRSVYPELSVACKYIEVGVSMQDRRIGANCNGADETINELADSLSFAAALTMDGSRMVIVDGSRR